MLWHTCKNGTMVNLEAYRVFRVTDYGREGSILYGYLITPLTEQDIPSSSRDELAVGTREECEAEMREIEEKVMVWQKPMLLMGRQ